MRAGIAEGMTPGVFDEQDNGYSGQASKIRTFVQQGTSGIIPKVKINYFEVASLAGGQVTKDECRNIIESTIIGFSNQVRKGQAISFMIPRVGNLQIRNNIAGVIFNKELIQASRGQTAKGYQHVYGTNNWMNHKIYEPNRADRGSQAADLREIPTIQPQWDNYDNTIKVPNTAKQWMKRNLDYDLDQQYQSAAIS